MDESLKPFALCIGELCMEWAFLEHSISGLFIKVSRWEDTPEALTMLSCLDIRQQINALRLGAEIRCVNKYIVNLVQESLDYVDNQLRSERNRIVHDMWIFDEHHQSAFRLWKKAKPGQEPRIFPGQVTKIELPRINQFIQDVVEESRHLYWLQTFLDCPRDFVDFPKPQSKPPARLFLRHLREMQSQKDSVGSKPRRPPRPSAASRRRPKT